MQLHCDGLDPQASSVDSPTWQEVEKAICRLDGHKYTDMTLGGIGGDPYIAVGGGAGNYFVFIWTQDERNLILSKCGEMEGRETLIVGGQAADFPCRQIVELADAVRAVHAYFITGKPDPSMTWEED